MMYCPECKEEYENGESCPKCNGELVGTVSFPSESEKENNLIQIAAYSEYYQAEILASNLRSIGADVYILSQKDSSIVAPGNLSLIKVFIDKEYYKDALEYLESIDKEGPVEGDIFDK